MFGFSNLVNMWFWLGRKSKLDDDEEKPVEETENEGETNLGLEEDDDGRTKL